MKSILLIGIMVLLAIVATASFGFNMTSAQMVDNATLGNMTGGNMTMGEQMNQSGSISGVERFP